MWRTIQIRGAVLLVGLSVGGVCVASCCGDELPTAAELESAMRINREAFAAFRVRYSYVLARHEGYRDHQQLSADSIELVLRKGTFPAIEKERMTALIESIRSEAKDFRPGVAAMFRAEVWRAGVAVQVRLPTNEDRFPESKLSAGNLSNDFGGISIYSRSGNESGWSSWSNSTRQSAITLNTELPSAYLGLPPLMIGSGIADGRLHPMDRPAVGGPDGMIVSGRERIGDFDTVVVERSTIQPWPQESSAELKSRVVLTEVFKAWLDINHGYLPRRIAREPRWFCDGKLAEPAHYINGLPPIVDDVVIEKIPGGGFYPTGGTVRTWTHRQDRTWPTPLEVFDGLKPAPEVTKLLVDEARWTAEVIVPKELPEFDLKKLIPTDALVLDAAARQIMVPDSQGQLIRAKAEQLAVQPKHGYSIAFLAGCVGIALGVVAVFVRMLWRYSASK